MAKGMKPSKATKGRGKGMKKPMTKPMTKRGIPNTYPLGVIAPTYTYRFRFSGGTLG